MSFSPEWLALREPADLDARNKDLILKLIKWAHAPRVLDLGSGTGSSYRALSPLIGGEWTLTDWDANLLNIAANRHADDVAFGDTLEVDLNVSLEGVLAKDYDLVCGSALIDLTSTQWLDRLAANLHPKAALYMALSYDGREEWAPMPPHEIKALGAFHRHQVGDKGFGAALGPDAPAYLAMKLRARGWTVFLTESWWNLKPGALLSALADGSHNAVAETGLLTADALQVWHQGRRAAKSARIGHLDLLALPPA